MEKLKDLMKDYEIKREGKSLPDWQVWALDFCKKYGITRKDYARVMSVAKQYDGRLDYLRHIDGWLSDYPSIKGGVLRLFFWKLGEDKKKSVKKESKLIYM